jgi:hypothetical protein
METRIKLKELRLPLFITILFILNILIYWRASLTIEPARLIFAECARNSGRTSAALNLILLLMLGYVGLKTIFNSKSIKKIFLTVVILFAVNHLIHFFFVLQNLDIKGIELVFSQHKRNIITFIVLTILPFLLFFRQKLNWFLYIAILAHFFNVTYIIAKLFFDRYKPVDPAYTHRLGVLIMIAASMYALYRIYAERSLKFSSNHTPEIEEEV